MGDPCCWWDPPVQKIFLEIETTPKEGETVSITDLLCPQIRGSLRNIPFPLVEQMQERNVVFVMHLNYIHIEFLRVYHSFAKFHPRM